MALFDANVEKQLKGILGEMTDPVSLVFFTQEFECHTCKDTRSFAEEFSAMSDKIDLSVYDFVNDKEKAAEYGVDKIPALLLLDKDKKDTGVKFYGLPGGYEINSFVGSIMEVSGSAKELPADTAQRIAAIDRDVHIEVFVTLT